MRRETISIHGGFTCDPTTKTVAPPIYQNVAHEFESADEGAALFNLEASGYRYSRIANPTTDILEKRVALLEGGVAALAVASGQAALNYAFLTLADRGSSVVAAMGGAIVDSGRFHWSSQASRFPMFCEPDESYHGLIYVDRFGREAFIARARSVYQRTTGAVLAPMSAFLLLQGIETLALRMERHADNAREVAHFLRADPRVAWVDYVGFPDSPYHALAHKFLAGRAPSLLTFGVVGGLDAAKAFYDGLKLIKRLVNIGDTRTLCCHPASTTHREMTPEEQRLAGARAETFRLSVGIEHPRDIVVDLDQALRAATPAVTRAAAE